MVKGAILFLPKMMMITASWSTTGPESPVVSPKQKGSLTC